MTLVRHRVALRFGAALVTGLGLVTVATPAGAATKKPATASVVVLARPHAVRATASTKGPATAKVRVSGRVKPARTGRVVLQRHRGKGWLDIGRAALTSKGLYVLTSTGLPAGRYSLRVVEAATKARKAVTGAAFTVTVMAPRKVVAQPTPTAAPQPPAPQPPAPQPPRPTPAPMPAPPAPSGPTVPEPAQPVACSAAQPLPASPDQLAISYVLDPLGYVGTSYGTEIWATGGVPPYDIATSSPDSEGIWVSGGRLDNTYFGGQFIQGVPRKAGVFHYQVTVTDDAGNTATADLCLQFAQPLRFVTSTLPTAAAGSPYSAPLLTDGGFAPVLLSTTSDVSSAEGLYVHGSNLLGTPSTSTISSVPVTALDGSGFAWTTWLTLTVGPLPPARTLHVPGDASTISGAIAAAGPGDTILVGPGTYHDNLDFAGKAVTVRSTDGAAHTTIVGATSGPVASFTSQEPPQAVLDGFTLRGRAEELSAASPQPTPAGGGVDIAGASPTVENDVIGPAWAQSGSGVSILGGAATLSHDTISGNVATQNSFSDGGGIAISGATDARLVDNVVSGNSYGIGTEQAESVSMEGNLVTGNQYGALVAGALDLSSVDDAFVRNDTQGGWTATNIPDGVLVQPLFGGRAALLNDTVADNGIGVPLDTRQGTSVRDTVVEATADLVDMVHCDGDALPPDYTDDVFWNTVARDRRLDSECILSTRGDKVADPGFVNRGSGDFTPGQGSSLVDAADSSGSLPALDQAGHPRVVDGNGDGTPVADIGAYERQ
jgi:hypothetical protein